MQLLHQFWLPQRLVWQGLAPGTNRLIGQPGFHHGGSIKPVVVDGISDRACQLPEREIQNVQRGALPAFKPLLQWSAARVFEQSGQQIQERPHQVLGSPGVWAALRGMGIK